MRCLLTDSLQSVKCTFEKKEREQSLNVWVQPVEWSGPEKDWPIKQLSLRVTHYLDNKISSGKKAIVKSDSDCG